jgi:hypothetical protein
MADIPKAILSEHFQERMNGRRLVSAVFTTFRFDPAFFEQEVLPVFLDVPLSHAPEIKLAQLEDVLKTLRGSIAVYYDENGLVAEARAAKLDIRRIAVRHRQAIFHPKNVFALVEDLEADEEGHKAQAVLAACMSANLTQAGWWENVEVCHVEEIREGDFTRTAEDIIRFLDALERRIGEKAGSEGHEALRDVRAFLRGTGKRTNRSSDGRLHPHFFAGLSSVGDFLEETAGGALQNLNLEIISPYFDGGPTSPPLADLIRRFNPREVRVFLPRSDKGEALCDERLYEWVRDQPGVAWSELPKDLLRRGKGEDVRPRTVHAKVYRFFSGQPKKEILFIASANLTSAAHQNGGNAETGFLVELEPMRRPEWWTTVDGRRTSSFDPRKEDEGNAASGGTRLSLRYSWDKGTAEAFWDQDASSPRLRVESQGSSVFDLESVPGRTWTFLPGEKAAELKRILVSTSLLSVTPEGGEPGLMLVQEEGMSHRPSLVLDLSPAQILKYWALLTAEQRAAFVEAHAPQIASTSEGAALLARYAPLSGHDTLFDRFAGIFHAFGCLERSVRAALHPQEENRKEATYRLFGQKYDSLGSLLSRLEKDATEGKGDAVEHYVIVLCARQLIQELKRDFRDYWGEHARDHRELIDQLERLGQVRTRLIDRDPGEMPQFLDWFDDWFLKKAAPVVVEEPS